jgi:integration host factor subunit beta
MESRRIECDDKNMIDTRPKRFPFDINTLKDEDQISKRDAAAIVDTFFGNIFSALAEGDRVEIRGLCSFYVKNYKSYAGRNPKTGEKVKVKGKKLRFFKCRKELKDRVDY